MMTVDKYLHWPFSMVYLTLGFIWAELLVIGLAVVQSLYKQRADNSPRQVGNTAGKKRGGIDKRKLKSRHSTRKKKRHA